MTELTNAEKKAILDQKKRNVQIDRYAMDLDLKAARMIDDQKMVEQLTDQINKMDLVLEAYETEEKTLK